VYAVFFCPEHSGAYTAYRAFSPRGRPNISQSTKNPRGQKNLASPNSTPVPALCYAVHPWLSFILGLLSKPMLRPRSLSVLLLLDYWPPANACQPSSRNFSKVWQRRPKNLGPWRPNLAGSSSKRSPFFVLPQQPPSAITLVVQGTDRNVSNVRKTSRWIHAWENVLAGYVLYIRDMFWANPPGPIF